jgi:hypothetical protein
MWTKEEKAEYARNYNKLHPISKEKRKQYQQKFWANHPGLKYKRKNDANFKKYKREYYRKYRQDHLEKIRLKDRVYYAKNKVVINRKAVIRQQQCQTKHNARSMAQKTVSIKDTCCVDCKSNINLVRHHEDYLKPKKVVILCDTCHMRRHSKYA